MTRSPNRNQRRLVAAVVAAWLVGATGGLAVLPNVTKAFAFCGAFAAFLGVALWNAAPPRKGRWREGPYPELQSGDVLAIRHRYRLRWLAAVAVIVVVQAAFNAFSFADTALPVIGAPVSAQVVRTGDPFNGYVECALARPDGTPIPGALTVEGTECPAHAEVLVDPFGLLDPALAVEDGWVLPVLSLVLLAAALALCVPAARPRTDGEGT